MRTLTLSILILLTAGIARADEPQVLVPLHLLSSVAPEQRLALREHARSQADDARLLRNGGLATTLVGTVMTAIGVGLFASNLCIDCSGGSVGSFIAGAALIGFGQVGVIAGIPMWAAGGARLNQAERTQLSLSATGARLTF